MADTSDEKGGKGSNQHAKKGVSVEVLRRRLQASRGQTRGNRAGLGQLGVLEEPGDEASEPAE